MDVQEFQKKLGEFCEIAKTQNKTVTGQQVREFFGGMELDQGQLLKIIQYLKVQGISIEGAEISGDSEETGETKQKLIPLTPEEEAYLKEYREGLVDLPETDRSTEELFAELSKGKEGAAAALAQRYLLTAAELSVKMNCEEMFLADLIQEANLCLMDALRQPEPALKSDGWLRREMIRGIARVIEEQTEQKLHDDSLVARVEKLDRAIRELSEDEDGKTEFSVNELAIILDMDVEEMKDILRLTGDDQ